MGDSRESRSPSVAQLAALGLLIGATATGLTGALGGDQGLTALGWVATVATVAALVVAIGVYRLQEASSGIAHKELLDAFDAQGELLANLPREAAAPASGSSLLTDAQTAKIEEEFGRNSVASVWDTGAGRGNRPRLVLLNNGSLVTVYSGGRVGGTYVRKVAARDI